MTNSRASGDTQGRRDPEPDSGEPDGPVHASAASAEHDHSSGLLCGSDLDDLTL
jgi:hypothetical protein